MRVCVMGSRRGGGKNGHFRDLFEQCVIQIIVGG